jgi:hypothetical protein
VILAAVKPSGEGWNYDAMSLFCEEAPSLVLNLTTGVLVSVFVVNKGGRLWWLLLFGLLSLFDGRRGLGGDFFTSSHDSTIKAIKVVSGCWLREERNQFENEKPEIERFTRRGVGGKQT